MPKKEIVLTDKEQKRLEMIQEINENINLTKIQNAIFKQHGTVYKYCIKFGESESEMSLFFNKHRPITLYWIWKHCKNLGMNFKVSFS